jgi:hypothetical protein
MTTQAQMNMDAYDGVFTGNSAGTTYAALPANMMNASAADPYDWNAVLTNGIKNAAANAIYTAIGGAYASGQLQPSPLQPGYSAQPQGNGGGLLIVGLVLFMLLGGND